MHRHFAALSDYTRQLQHLDSQRNVLDHVLTAVQESQPGAIFVDACGGTGKTFLLNTTLAAVRTMVLYAGASQVGDPANIKFAIPANTNNTTDNIVYKEALSI